jgi:hypothetical protein
MFRTIALAVTLATALASTAQAGGNAAIEAARNQNPPKSVQQPTGYRSPGHPMWCQIVTDENGQQVRRCHWL